MQIHIEKNSIDHLIKKVFSYKLKIEKKMKKRGKERDP